MGSVEDQGHMRKADSMGCRGNSNTSGLDTEEAQVLSIQLPSAAGLSVVCGSASCVKYERVMPLFQDESLLLAQCCADYRRPRVLDIGTGSGILAVVAALQASESVGVDINPRAVQCARQTALLSSPAGTTTFLCGDLYEPVRSQRFDCIVANPPFVPLPPGFRMFLSADGGPDGLSIVRRVLAGVHQHLTVDGTFLMLTMGLGDAAEPLIYRYLHETFRSRDNRVTTTHIYESRNIEAELFFELFRDVPTYSEWRRFLEKQNLTHLYYMLHEVVPNGRFEHVEEYNTLPLPQEEMSGSWAGRINRFRRWFEEKKKAATGDETVAGPVVDTDREVERKSRGRRARTAPLVHA